MRATKGRGWQPAGTDLPQNNAPVPNTGAPRGVYHRRIEPRRQPAGSDLPRGLLLAAAFFLGYLPGIIAGRDTAGTGSVLADYYMDKQTFADWRSVFADLYAGTFLQATLVLLCGFCALGMLLLVALFAVKGMYLGYCAAGVFAQSGAKGLVVHWLLTCLPDLSVLLLLFSLALCAMPLCRALLQSAFGITGHSAAYGNLYSYAKALVLRYAVVLGAGAACCALGAGSAVFLAGILL